MSSQNALMGQRLRALRLEKGIQQGEAARRLSISPAYLSLMESGRRAIHLPLLIKMLGLYGITMESFMASVGETRVDDGLAELVSDPLLRSLSLSETDLSSLSAKAVTTITALFNIYKSTRQQHQDLLQSVAARERGAEEPGGSALRFELTPFDEVTDFLEANHNWFPALEERAERVWAEAKLGRKATSQVLAELLRARYDIDVRLVNPDDPESSVIRRWDHERGVLTLSADMPEQRLKFQLANTLGMRLLDREGLHHDIHKDF
ncbi:MAG: helix-turn-helix domain-containing protein, partial [Myxococcota bacterium]